MVASTTIRKAAKDDIEAIQEVARASWERAYGDFLGQDVVEAMLDEGYSDSFLAEAIDAEQMEMFVAESDGEVAGYVSSEAPRNGDIGQVSIYVHPDHWRKGIGTALLERATDHLRDHGATAMQDTVLAANEIGTSFYQDHCEKAKETAVDLAGESRDANVFRRQIG